MDELNDANQDFLNFLTSTFTPDPSLEYFGKDIAVDVTSANAANFSFTAQTVITNAELNATGTLDEGWVATVTDNLTSPLMVAATKGMPSVTTSLSVKALCAVKPGTRIAIENKMVSCEQPPASTTVFRDATNSEIVYATAQHTKFFKPGLVRKTRAKM